MAIARPPPQGAGLETWDAASVFFSAGSQLLGWGSTDLFSPVDVLKQSDFRDPLDREDRGAHHRDRTDDADGLQDPRVGGQEDHCYHDRRHAGAGQQRGHSQWGTQANVFRHGTNRESTQRG